MRIVVIVSLRHEINPGGTFAQDKLIPRESSVKLLTNVEGLLTSLHFEKRVTRHESSFNAIVQEYDPQIRILLEA